MASSTFPTVTTGVTVESATDGGITGDGSSGNKLAFDFGVLAAPPGGTALGASGTPFGNQFWESADGVVGAFNESLVFNTDPSFAYWYWGGVVTPSAMSSSGILAAFAQTGAGANPLYSFAETKAGTAANPAGAQLTATNTSAAALTGSVVGAYLSANLIAGQVGFVRGLNINNEIDGGTTTTGGIEGISVGLNISAGTHPVAAGVHVLEVTGATLNYAVLTDAATPSLFGGSVTASYFQTTEIVAPSAGAVNTVRIYAQDNGGGKTQLMALFASGSAQQLAIQP